MTLKSGIEIPQTALSELCRNYGVLELFIFGSAARGDMRADSDIDVLVDFLPEARIGLFRFVSLSGELEKLLGRKIDLVTKQGLKPRVRPGVLSEARLVYAA